jgi:hypothetical protein
VVAKGATGVANGGDVKGGQLGTELAMTAEGYGNNDIGDTATAGRVVVGA